MDTKDAVKTNASQLVVTALRAAGWGYISVDDMMHLLQTVKRLEEWNEEHTLALENRLERNSR